jgi:hypothetical protein
MICSRARTVKRARLLPAAASAFLTIIASNPGIAEPAGPFAGLAGWWGGAGRLSFKEGKLEQVKCRATYFVSESGNELKQTVRCASGSGKIEIVANVTHEAGKLTGTWSESNYSLSGGLSGEVTPKGFRVQVKGADAALRANMDIIVKDRKQMVEIQFLDSTLLGLTLLLASGDPAGH